MRSFGPSCNTVEGVWHVSEHYGGKPVMRNESEGEFGSLKWDGEFARLHHCPIWIGVP